MSLARTISGDTIVGCIAALLVAHLYLYDYGFVNSATDSLQGSISLFAAVFSSVLAASRLVQRKQVFVHILFSLEMYLLSPFLRRFLCRTHSAIHVATTALMGLGAALLLAALSAVAASAFCAASLFITFACPMWLMRIQKYKQKINGPWDEAVPKWSSLVSNFQYGSPEVQQR